MTVVVPCCLAAGDGDSPMEWATGNRQLAQLEGQSTGSLLAAMHVAAVLVVLSPCLCLSAMTTYYLREPLRAPD